MNPYVKNTTTLLAVSLLGLLSACSDSGEATGTSNPPIANSAAAPNPTAGTPAVSPPAATAPNTPMANTPDAPASNPAVANDFAFPDVTEANGSVGVTQPTGPLPTFSARRTLSKGTGSVIGFGDPVVVRYSMYSWSNGTLVETTDDFDEPITIQAGVTEGVPDYLSKSLLGRNLGDRIQVVFKSEMEDLPSYHDNADAYILVIDLI